MRRSNSIAKAGAVISWQETHVDCPKCMKNGQKKRQYKNCCPVLSSSLNSVFRLSPIILISDLHSLKL